jgi:REP element-mobilizing transposase RayT
LWKDDYKNVIVSSLQYLSDAGKVDVFAFVIMPNHIHLIWRVNEMNGKETAQGSFLKCTAHEFKKMLKNDTDNKLASYAVNAANKNFEFWQRDSLAVHFSPLWVFLNLSQAISYPRKLPPPCLRQAA